MSDFFQSTRHRKSTYNRPTNRWICGGECKDCPCYLGPDTKGNCQAGRKFDNRTSGQCLPRKSGGRWLCTRQDTHGGEPCEQGPLPDGSCCMSVTTCRPKRSLRSQRGLFAIGLSLATVVWLVAILAPNPSKGVDPTAGLDPGPLSANHSFLDGQCSRCHSDQEMSSTAITDIHGVAMSHRAIDDGKLCLSCHKSIGGADNAFAFSPHTAGELKQESKGSGKSGTLLMIAASNLASNRLSTGGIQCSTCHQEHHGEEFNIATLSNKQCQVCHQDQFESFSKGHPDFSKSNYPYSSRTAIRFDHYSHYQTHFKEELETHPDTVPAGYDPSAAHLDSKSCAACHETGKSGEPMAVKPFESSCAACHENDVRKGVPLAFLAFPPLNVGSLDERLTHMDPPRVLGKWVSPIETTPWPTLQLLSADGRAAWTRLRAAGIDPFNQENEIPDDPKVVSDIEAVTWAIKELAHDLSQNDPGENPSKLMGHDELVRRLADSGFDNPEALISGLPASGFEAMRQGFTHRDPEMKGDKSLLEEVKAMRSGTKPSPPQPAAPAEEATKPAAATPTEPESFGGDSGESFGKEDSGESFGEESAPPADKAGETFGEEKTENFGDEGGESFGEPAGETFGGEGGETFGGGEEFGAEPKKEDADENPPPEELSAMDATTWASRGGWYQEYGALYYRSSGHADPLIKSWLDALAHRVNDPLSLAQLKEGFDFRAGAESQASGSCLKCHAVDEIRDRELRLTGARIDWQSLSAGSARRTLTRYDHATHLLLTDCRTCHQTQTENSGFLTSFPMSGDWDATNDWSVKAAPSHFVSNFKTIQKDTCAECHQSEKAGDSCIQCHLYHKATPHPLPSQGIHDSTAR